MCIDNESNAEIHLSTAFVKDNSGDKAGALASARESVSIDSKLGIDNESAAPSSAAGSAASTLSC